jgi:hypothetical protein
MLDTPPASYNKTTCQSMTMLYKQSSYDADQVYKADPMFPSKNHHRETEHLLDTLTSQTFSLQLDWKVPDEGKHSSILTCFHTSLVHADTVPTGLPASFY